MTDLAITSESASTITQPRCSAAPRRPSRIRMWLNVWSERRHLAQLDGARLADIGVTPREAAREARRDPWDVGMNRR